MHNAIECSTECSIRFLHDVVIEHKRESIYIHVYAHVYTHAHIHVSIQVSIHMSTHTRFLNDVVIEHKRMKRQWAFGCRAWLSSDGADSSAVRTLKAVDVIHATDDDNLLESFAIRLRTGNVHGAGTDAHVSVELFGVTASSGVLALSRSEESWPSFEAGHVDTFRVSTVPPLPADTRNNHTYIIWRITTHITCD